jgi:tetratricopeptide (TPR) repeat protein
VFAHGLASPPDFRPSMSKRKPKKNSARAVEHDAPARLSARRWRVPLICFGLVAITWLIFGRTITFDFLNYDDSFYVYQNPSISDGLTRAGLIKAFTRPLVGNWHPLTSISLMLDAEWSHLSAGGYHLTNVILHTLTVLLLFFALRLMTGATWRSAFVAALFAIHPLRAESVVWVSERKDVLSGLFFMLGLLAWHRYTRNPPRLSNYLLVAVALALGLLSKAMLVTFPFLLLLLDWWPLERTRTVKWSQLILEKIPLLFLVAAISVATVLAQEPALAAGRNWSLLERIENAVLAIWVYVRQMFWPADLAVFYPHPNGGIALWLVSLAVLALLLMIFCVVIWRRKYPYLLTGWFWYLGLLAPVIGLVQVGWQAHADRYTYLPQIGLYLMLSWGIAETSAHWRVPRSLLTAGAALALGALVLLAWRQVGYWSSPVNLWRHTLAVTTDNDVAERGLGTALIKLGRIDEAIVHDRAALRIRPGDVNGLTNLANALLQKGEFAEAIKHYREVLNARPNDAENHRNLGKALYRNGEVEAGMEEFRRALRLQPNDSDAAYSLGNAFLEKGEPATAIPWFRKAIAADPKSIAAHYNLGIALQRNGEIDSAIAEFRQTLRLGPGHVEARNNLAIALLKKNLTNEAIAEWRAALRIQPKNAEIHNNLGVAFLKQGNLAEAVSEFRETLQLQPDKVPTALTLGWILATAPEENLRDPDRALELAKSAFRLAGDRNLMTYRVLAAAFAAKGKYRAAINAAEEGAERADAAGQDPIAELLRRDLALYRQEIPLRDASHGGGSAGAP